MKPKDERVRTVRIDRRERVGRKGLGLGGVVRLDPRTLQQRDVAKVGQLRGGFERPDECREAGAVVEHDGRLRRIERSVRAGHRREEFIAHDSANDGEGGLERLTKTGEHVVSVDRESAHARPAVRADRASRRRGARDRGQPRQTRTGGRERRRPRRRLLQRFAWWSPLRSARADHVRPQPAQVVHAACGGAPQAWSPRRAACPRMNRRGDCSSASNVARPDANGCAGALASMRCRARTSSLDTASPRRSRCGRWGCLLNVSTPCSRPRRSREASTSIGAGEPSGSTAGRRPKRFSTGTPSPASSERANPPKRCCGGIDRSP